MGTYSRSPRLSLLAAVVTIHSGSKTLIKAHWQLPGGVHLATAEDQSCTTTTVLWNQKKNQDDDDDDDGDEAKRFRTIWTAADVSDDVAVNL